MKISLIITNAGRKTQVVISNTFKVFTLNDAVQMAKNNGLENVSVVRSVKGGHLRSLPNMLAKDNIDTLSVTATDIMAYANSTRHFESTDAISVYVAHYHASIIGSGKPFIETYHGHKAYTDQVRELIRLHGPIIKQAADEFSIDPYLLGAIVIDESVRLSPFEGVVDSFLLDLIGRDVSVGVAQVKLDTANGLIRDGFYNPNPKDKKLPFPGTLSNENRKYLYPYVSEPKHNLRFATARIKEIISKWSKFVDLSDRPDIIGTLYSKGLGNPHPNPKANERGEQISNEFYKLAEKWLA